MAKKAREKAGMLMTTLQESLAGTNGRLGGGDELPTYKFLAGTSASCELIRGDLEAQLLPLLSKTL